MYIEMFFVLLCQLICQLIALVLFTTQVYLSPITSSFLSSFLLETLKGTGHSEIVTIYCYITMSIKVQEQQSTDRLLQLSVLSR